MKFELILLLLTGSFVLDCGRANVIPSFGKLNISENLSIDAVGCSIKTRGDLIDPQPLFIIPGSSNFWPVDNTGNLNIAYGQSIELHCSNYFANPFDTAKTLTAECVGGKNFKIKGYEYNFNQLVCKSWPTFTARKTGKTCNGGTTLIQVGFVVDTRFLEIMQVCFNEPEEVTRYVSFKITPANDFYQTGVSRLTFGAAGFYKSNNVDKLYTQESQKQVIDRTLGGVGYQYFDESKSFFLSRGHLAAKSDYIYGTQQRATFLFINAAPQWQRFNAGNWEKIEDGVKTFAKKNNYYLDSYTGIYGVTTLPDRYGVQQLLYLNYDANNNGLIPVPMLYYRILIEPITKRGVVLIGVNNPHKTLDEIRKDYIICDDVSDKILWLQWKKTDISAGYSYACEVPNFTKVVKTLPTLDVKSLLY